MRSLPIPKVRSRQINDADIERVVDLLARGFGLRPRSYWQRALETLSSHQALADMPRYGYLLESGGDLVGVILLIFSSIPGDDSSKMRCNVSSWYVEPTFRSHAADLAGDQEQECHLPEHLARNTQLRQRRVAYPARSPGAADGTRVRLIPASI